MHISLASEGSSSGGALFVLRWMLQTMDSREPVFTCIADVQKNENFR